MLHQFPVGLRGLNHLELPCPQCIMGKIKNRLKQLENGKIKKYWLSSAVDIKSN